MSDACLEVLAGDFILCISFFVVVHIVYTIIAA